MDGRKKASKSRPKTLVPGVLRSVDVITAVLLLTGQITATGVFLSPHAYWLSLSGPIIGGRRLKGTSVPTGAILDFVDIITALLLILGEIRVTGPWITSGGFSLPVTGPAFGFSQVPMEIDPTDKTTEFYSEFRQMAIEKFVPSSNNGNH